MSIIKPQNIPNRPGVYVFKKSHKPIYVGKASSLKARLGSYFLKNVGEKVKKLLEEADEVNWTETRSEIEALIKESELIKIHTPKFNVVMRDDKGYFYAAITKEEFPRIFLTHQPRTGIKNQESGIRARRKIRGMNYIGPFTSGSALKTTLRLLRTIFPYCVCKEIHKRPCLNAQIGRCPGYCCMTRTDSGFLKAEYKKNITSIASIFLGKKKRLLRDLRRQMKELSASRDYEKAAKARDQILGIENIFSHAFVLQERGATRNKALWQWDATQKTVKNVFGTEKNISRVEGYDISNISGTEATGSMVVFIDGKPEKSEYRKFKIKTVHQISDIAMHKEVMRRRLNHPKWKYPDVILIDGGKGQLNALLSVLAERRFSGKILAAGLAKREEELYIEGRSQPMRLRSLPFETASFFQRVRDESHRFAKKYHHKLREMGLREK